ncbi:MAG: DUF2283 domain-containing protein [bacterium]|nr:DUF2283 domain-containing protein [bacterium]
MQKEYDQFTDTIYFRFKDGKVSKTKEEGLLVVDYDKKGDVLGIEVFNYSKLTDKDKKSEGPSLQWQGKNVGTAEAYEIKIFTDDMKISAKTHRIGKIDIECPV